MNVDELRRLLDKVTPGEWMVFPPEHGYDNNDSLEGGLGAIFAGDIVVCSFGSDDTYYNVCGYYPSPDDATLIALAPSLARRVIAAENLVEALAIAETTIADLERANASYQAALSERGIDGSKGTEE